MKNINKIILTCLVISSSYVTMRAPGSSSNTYAPKSFTPANQYNSPGMFGNYFASSQVATIHDPSQANPISYTFNNVIADSNLNNEAGYLSMGYSRIGSYSTGNPISFAQFITYLYGIEQ